MYDGAVLPCDVSALCFTCLQTAPSLVLGSASLEPLVAFRKWLLLMDQENIMTHGLRAIYFHTSHAPGVTLVLSRCHLQRRSLLS